MATFPALPLWTDAYLSDTDHLTFEEHGVYLRLLMMIWRNPECRVPNDAKWICRRLRVTQEYFDQTVLPILEEYLDNTGNYITSRRLQREYEYVRKKASQQRVRAKSRWIKEKGVCHGNATSRIATALPDTDTNTAPQNHVSDKSLKSQDIDVCHGNAPTPTPVKKDTLSEYPKKKNKTGLRLPENWQPDDGAYAFALDMIGASRTHDEIAKFIDYWLSESGQRARKVDWSRTFKNWIRRASEHTTPKGAGRATPDLVACVRQASTIINGRSRLQPDGIQADHIHPAARPGSGGATSAEDLVAIAAGHDLARVDQAQGQDQHTQHDDGRTDPDADSIPGRTVAVSG